MLQHLKHTWDSDLYRTERVYGLHAAWEKRMDRAVLSTVARLPGIPSSHVGIDTLLRRHDKMGFEDVLGSELAAPGGAERRWRRRRWRGSGR